MALKKSQRSLRSWTKQKWRTKSGKKSSETGERYLPEAAIKSLTAEEYARTSRKKRKTLKQEQEKNPKEVGGDYIPMKIQKILLELLTKLQQMLGKLWLKLKELGNLLHVRFKSLLCWNKEPKSQVKRNKRKSPKKAKKQ